MTCTLPISSAAALRDFVGASPLIRNVYGMSVPPAVSFFIGDCCAQCCRGDADCSRSQCFSRQFIAVRVSSWGHYCFAFNDALC